MYFTNGSDNVTVELSDGSSMLIPVEVDSIPIHTLMTLSKYLTTRSTIPFELLICTLPFGVDSIYILAFKLLVSTLRLKVDCILIHTLMTLYMNPRIWRSHYSYPFPYDS